jgi:hypothetical protein
MLGQILELLLCHGGSHRQLRSLLLKLPEGLFKMKDLILEVLGVARCRGGRILIDHGFQLSIFFHEGILLFS